MLHSGMFGGWSGVGRGLGLASALGLSACGGVMRNGGSSSEGSRPLAEGGAINGSGAAPGNPLSKFQPSTGCGVPLPAEQVPTVPGSRTGYTELEVEQTGATLGANQPDRAGKRQFFLRVPADYDPNRPYRVVYIGQGCGGLRSGNTNTYPLFDEASGGTEQAVYVALSVPDNDANPGCYDNNSGSESQEWEAFDLIHTFVESHYCVDNDRIYVSGYSTGAWLATMWGCYFGGTPSPPLDAPDLVAGRMERRFAPRWAIRGSAAAESARNTRAAPLKSRNGTRSSCARRAASAIPINRSTRSRLLRSSSI